MPTGLTIQVTFWHGRNLKFMSKQMRSKQWIAIAAVAVVGVAALSFSLSGRTSVSAAAASSAAASTSGSGTPVIVELFTSEGCSSCPPADALLIELDKQPIKGAEIIALGQHVDYWNRLGWKDRFSSAQFSERQSEYSEHLGLNGVYTPQMVVDGQKEFVGNSRQDAYSAVKRAATEVKPATITLERSGAEAINIKVSEAAGLGGKQLVYLAVTESGLENDVASGENSGRKLRHSAVVRTLKQIGSVKDGQFSQTEHLTLSGDWNRSQMKAVVFVQEAGRGKILGAASVGLGG